jgi:hypothetical protein
LLLHLLQLLLVGVSQLIHLLTEGSTGLLALGLSHLFLVHLSLPKLTHPLLLLLLSLTASRGIKGYKSVSGLGSSLTFLNAGPVSVQPLLSGITQQCCISLKPLLLLFYPLIFQTHGEDSPWPGWGNSINRRS